MSTTGGIVKLTQFERWCKAQFGERCKTHSLWTDDQLMAARNNAKAEAEWMERELEHRREWDLKITAATYAKNAAPTKFTF